MTIVISPSVVLFEIDGNGVTVLESERDTPRPIHMDGISRRSVSPKRVEIEARQVHLLRPGRGVQPVKPPKNMFLKL